ncbi:MAG: hypothetical protein ACT4P4_01395 [Betaproteobacteria bacterium]
MAAMNANTQTILADIVFACAAAFGIGIALAAAAAAAIVLIGA